MRIRYAHANGLEGTPQFYASVVSLSPSLTRHLITVTADSTAMKS
jgi:hypothetical protein